MGLFDSIKKKIADKKEEDRIYNEAYRKAKKEQLAIQAEQTAIEQRKAAVRKVKENAGKSPFDSLFGKPAAAKQTVKRTTKKKSGFLGKFVIKDGKAYPVATKKKKKKKRKPREEKLITEDLLPRFDEDV